MNNDVQTPQNELSDSLVTIKDVYDLVDTWANGIRNVASLEDRQILVQCARKIEQELKDRGAPLAATTFSVLSGILYSDMLAGDKDRMTVH